ncbi:MAG: hypothetical protein ACJAY5_001554 [Actinomycetes bacterium]|jgi:hypothetical protein
MAVFGVSALVASTGDEQWALALIGMGLGVTRFASRSLTLGSAANAVCAVVVMSAVVMSGED